MKYVKNPHDKYFRSAMSNKKVAIDFFKHYLPTEFQSKIDLETIKIQK